MAPDEDSQDQNAQDHGDTAQDHGDTAQDVSTAGTPAPRQTAAQARRAQDQAGKKLQASVQAHQEEMNENLRKGYIGVVGDPTPNYNYTVAGNDEPTPETDPEMRRKLREHQEEIAAALEENRPLPGRE